MKKPAIITYYPCPRCGEDAEVHETVRAFSTVDLPSLHLIDPRYLLDPGDLFVEGRIKMTCPKCGKISDKMWSVIAENCDSIDDPVVDNVRGIYMDRMRETWERMRRGEPEPDPGPSNCEYITFEGMYY